MFLSGRRVVSKPNRRNLNQLSRILVVRNNFKLSTMTRLNKLSAGLIALFLLIGCEKTENKDFSSDIEYVKYGTSFNECLGYCENDIAVRSAEIGFHKSGRDLNGLLPEVSNTVNIDARYWSELTEKIDFNAFSSLSPIHGCPDCADGGAEWIEIKSKGRSHKIIFEYRNEPNEIKEYVGYLRAYINSFQTVSDEDIDFNNRILVNQRGFIKRFAASAESNQWLIGIVNGTDTTYYYDRYLDARYQVDNLKIEFTGVLGFDSTLINKPDAEDVPVPDFQARNIRAFHIRTINN